MRAIVPGLRWQPGAGHPGYALDTTTMKKLFVLPTILLACELAFATPVTVNDLPKTPPPYGAYYLDTGAHYKKMSREERAATSDAIARRYGYANDKEALAACAKVQSDCIDSVRHKRDSDPIAIEEMRKYGFPTWNAAMDACIKNIERGDVNHCRVDPFLKLRLKGK